MEGYPWANPCMAELPRINAEGDRLRYPPKRYRRSLAEVMVYQPHLWASAERISRLRPAKASGNFIILGAMFYPFLSSSLQPFIASGYIFGSGFGDTVVL
jgi:hypothetical protein